jgi:hypothetical protein
MNAQPAERGGTADSIGSFLAVVAITAALFSLAYRPVRLDVFAIILAFVATGLCSAHQRLAGIAVAVGSACFILGMLIAIVADKPLF